MEACPKSKWRKAIRRSRTHMFVRDHRGDVIAARLNNAGNIISDFYFCDAPQRYEGYTDWEPLDDERITRIYNLESP
jgi:hypothetical protein